MLLIDSRENNDLRSDLGSQWRFIADNVMGGVSDGSLSPDSIEGRFCLRMRGTVRLDNNGGFIQATLDIGQTRGSDASGCQGLLLDVYGNDSVYNLHLRTDDISLPWQSYRASFQAPARWHSVKTPFDTFTGYRTRKKLNITRLRRIGIVAIGREFTADLRIGKLAYY
ncbi:MAG: CIA30 family protein [Gammaproteobacteria bacterium]|nr:CIA30 family protein [Gammaproteobacteria bacterium]